LRQAQFSRKFADGAFWTDRLRYTSDSDHSDCAARSPDEPFHVAWVACENRSLLPKGCRHHNGVNDIRRFGYA
jgi:predicted nuclease of predicted toxin-antitoxin system